MGTTDSNSPSGRDNSGDQSEASDPLELFFDLVFVFAFTRITAVVSHEPSWGGVVRGFALLAVLWWAWVTYTWLMDSLNYERITVERVVILTATALMFIVALAVPNAFSGTAVLFGVAYFVVRALHVALTLTTAGVDARHRFYHLVPGFLGGPALLLVAGFTDGPLQMALWIVGISIDFGILFVEGIAKFELQAEHFVERYRDIVIIAFGESVLAMGFTIAGDGLTLTPGLILVAFLGVVLIAALAWLYFDYVTLAAEDRFAATEGYERGVLARNSYAYLHLLIVAGIIFVAVGLEEAVSHVTEPLALIPAVSLYGGCVLYLFGHTIYRYYAIGNLHITQLVTVGLIGLLSIFATRVTALIALASITGLLVGLAVFETAHSPIRHDVRDR